MDNPAHMKCFWKLPTGTGHGLLSGLCILTAQFSVLPAFSALRCSNVFMAGQTARFGWPLAICNKFIFFAARILINHWGGSSLAVAEQNFEVNSKVQPPHFATKIISCSQNNFVRPPPILISWLYGTKYKYQHTCYWCTH